MTTLSQRANAFNTAQERKVNGLLQYVRRSRSIASMLPWMLLSGVMTLVVTAFMHAPWMDAGRSGRDFVDMWMENWLIAWAIAFPVAYMAGLLLMRLAAKFSAPAYGAGTSRHGLAFADITDASARVTAKNGLKVLRKPVRL
jgi:hypothetical protein